ncbi:hypothetical protein [Streptomyces sp. NPDC052127]|uniref:hypothetical protein n=1 Tax=Streptomyces sp. NPDC052127 TaxID=3155679 RepID=UPI003424859B
MRGVERRAVSVYAPPWLRPVLPLMVSAVARRSLSALPSEELERTTGVLGAVAPVPPVTPPQT